MYQRETKRQVKTMKISTLVIGLFISSIAFTQTKTIALKRHSKFSSHVSAIAYLNSPSNFGMAPEKWVKNSELKKVVFINDTTQAMVTKESCINEYSYQQQETEVWRAGTDTVNRHPVFSSDISVDSMRSILKKEYYFQNDMDDVKFVGFEQKTRENEQKTEKKEEKGQKKSRKRKTPYTKYGLLFLVFASSIGIGIINVK